VFHVFLSHNSQDKQAVEQLAQRLKTEAGLSPFLDTWSLVPGTAAQPAMERAIQDSQTVAVFFGPTGLGPWHDAEMQLALDRALRSRDDFRVIPVLLPGALSEQLPGFLRQRTWVDFREGLESDAAFARLVAGILGRAPEGDAFRLPDEPAPYRGLRSFDEKSSAFFFGRDPDIQRVLEKLRTEPFVAVVGPSGAGKSSLVFGGVLPHLERPGSGFEPGPRTWVLRPGDRPLRALADQVATLVAREQRLAQAEGLHERFRRDSSGLRTALATLTADSPGPCLLVVDQLEELFTLGHPDERGPFLANLQDAVLRSGGAIRVLVTLRADFFDRCLGVAVLRELLEDRQVLLGNLGEEALRDVITQPARLVGAYLERDLLTAILRDTSREPGALPLLEDALEQLWRARDGAWLTLAAYEASGGISKALERRAQGCYEALEPGEQEVARLVFLRLVSLGEGREDTRRRVTRGELSFPGVPPERVERVLQALSGPRARLLVIDQDTVEVAHEVLIHSWPTLHHWLEEDRRPLRVQRRLADATGEWLEKAKDPSYLYRGARLAEAEELFARRPALLNAQEREFLEASIHHRADQQRRELEEARRREEVARRSARKLRDLAIGLAVAVAALVGGGVLLYQKSLQAERETRAALEQKQLARSRELAINARLNIGEDSTRALLLLQEAQRLAPVDHFTQLLEDWARTPLRFTLRGHVAPLRRVVFSPDGSRLLTASEDGTARLWAASTGQLIAVLPGDAGVVAQAVFSPDGARVLTATEKGGIRLWEASTGKLLDSHTVRGASAMAAVSLAGDFRVLFRLGERMLLVWDASRKPLAHFLLPEDLMLKRAAFSPDGSRIVTVSRMDRVETYKGLEFHMGGMQDIVGLWDAASGKQLPLPRRATSSFLDTVGTIVISPDGARFLSASIDGKTVEVWNTASGERLASLTGLPPEVKVLAAAFSADGSRVLVGGEDRVAYLLNVTSGKLVHALTSHSAPVSAVAFSPDGVRLLTAGEDQPPRLWDAASGSLLTTLPTGALAMALSPDGSRLVTSASDHTARLWDIFRGANLISPKSRERIAAGTFLAGGYRVLTTSAQEDAAHVWDSATGTRLSTLLGHSSQVDHAAFSPDGARVLSISVDGTARIYEAASGDPVSNLSERAISTAVFSSDGARVLGTSRTGAARIYDVTSGQPLVTLEEELHVVEAAFSPDGARVFTTSPKRDRGEDHFEARPPGREDLLRIWNASSGRRISGWPIHIGEVEAATFSPDGNRLLTGLSSGTAVVWDASSGQPLATLSGHTSGVTSVAFSPDGTLAVTASWDDTVRVWEASSGKLLSTLMSHTVKVKEAAFSPDGSRILAFSRQRTLLTWPSWRWDLEAFAKLDVGRALTCEERETYLHEGPCPPAPAVPSSVAGTPAP
jgi:WD40 repeat protein